VSTAFTSCPLSEKRAQNNPDHASYGGEDFGAERFYYDHVGYFEGCEAGQRHDGEVYAKH